MGLLHYLGDADASGNGDEYGNDEAKQIVEFDENSIASYLRMFAETHGVNQRGMENIDILFPPEDDLLNQIPVGMPVYPPPNM